MKAWGLNDNFLGFIQTMYQILAQVVETLEVWLDLLVFVCLK